MTNVFQNMTAPKYADHTIVQFLVTEATREQLITDLGYSEDFKQLDAEMVEDEEFLAGTSYPELNGAIKLQVKRTADLTRVEIWGKL